MLAVIIFVIVPAIQPSIGESVEVMANSNHVEEGVDPGPFNTNPPTSGMHYSTPLPAGFYKVEDAAEIGPFPEGYLVHNLEHGYVVFWYNCELLSDLDCSQLEAGIRSVMNDAGNFKVVAFPWQTLDKPLVMTSWGRMLEFESFDESLAGRFVSTNRNKSPEPFAP
jgi:hypothetical protein